MNSISSTLEEFGYSWKDRLQNGEILSTIFVSCLSLYAFLKEITALFVLLFSLPTRPFILNDLIGTVLALPLTLLAPYFFVHVSFNLFPAIRASQKGMEVQVFEHWHYRWKFVSWKEVRALYPVVKFGWLYDRTGQCIYSVEVENLSTWHRQLSMMVGNANHHAIIIKQSFPNREILLDKIRYHLPKVKTA